MLRYCLVLAGVVTMFSVHAAVEYSVEEADEFGGSKKLMLTIADNSEQSAIVFACHPNKELLIQLYSEQTIFPDTSNRGRMEVDVTYRFDAEDAISSSWAMASMQYNNATYKGDSLDFARSLLASNQLGIRLDKSGDVYRYSLVGATGHVTEIMEACPPGHP